ncbi:MAG: transcriptional regulator [Rhodoglobus sp.]|jgi:DNA-binding HxlR family transcriptional regulator|nr:transcriptional regulator [Rhodoglobus sp.]
MAPDHMEQLCDSGRGVIVRDALERIGDKWTLLVVGMLDEKPMRFTALRQSVPGISQRMLTLTLRHLERDGLVSRTAYPEVPPRVEYALTPLGARLLPPVLELARWALDNAAEIRENREAYDGAATA